MPSLITKIGIKRYRASVAVPGTMDKRMQKLFPDDSKKSHRAAILWEKQTKDELRKQTGTVYISLLEWAEKYMDDVSTRCVNKTYKEKYAAFKQLFTFKKGIAKESVDVLTVQFVNDFLTHQCNTRSGNAANKDRKNLVAAWGWAVKTMSYFPRDIPNPFAAIEKMPEERNPRYVPSEQDFWKVYNHTGGQDKVMLLVYLHLAGRRREIFRMKKSDIDFPNKKVTLWTRKRKGGNLEPDVLPMTDELTTTLLSWCEARFSHDTIDKEHVFVCLDEYHFCKEYYGKPFKNRQHLMRKLCKKASVKHFGFHAIRHLSASILYRKGESVGFIQTVLRHKNPTTTQGYLRSLGLEDVRKGMNNAFQNPSNIDSTQIIELFQNGTSDG